jgi:hypothetical protein
MQADPTHRELSGLAIGLVSGDCGLEVGHFRDVIEQASVDEDNGTRSLCHFYDPDTGQGLSANTYTVVLGEAADLAHPPPRAGPLSERYLDAMRWAWDGMPDHCSWTGAIAAYDYSEASRKRAYEAVGHVLHLVQDMGQPDHASCRPHPGNYVHAYLAEAPASVRSWARQSQGIRDDRVGYEELWGTIRPADAAWRHGRTPRPLSSLKQAFDEVARASKAAEARLRLPAVNDGEIALGLAALRRWASVGVAWKAGQVALRGATPLAFVTVGQWLEGGLRYEWNVPLVPTIPVPPMARCFSNSSMRS